MSLPSFYTGSGDPNPSLHVCAASAFPTEPVPCDPVADKSSLEKEGFAGSHFVGRVYCGGKSGQQELARHTYDQEVEKDARWSQLASLFTLPQHTQIGGLCPSVLLLKVPGSGKFIFQSALECSHCAEQLPTFMALAVETGGTDGPQVCLG